MKLSFCTVIALIFCATVINSVFAETTILNFEPSSSNPVVYATNESAEPFNFTIGDRFQNADKTKNLFYGNPNSDGSIYQSSLYATAIQFSEGAGLSNNYAFTPASASWSGIDSDSWDGFAISQANDSLTAGYGNQYSAIAGGGYNGSSTFAVGYYSAWNSSEDLSNCSIDLTGADVNGVDLNGFFVTNTTYAYQSMRQGDSFSKQFTAADNDWLKLTIRGFDSEGDVVHTKDFFLAGFGSTNDSDAFEWRILDNWSWVDLEGWDDIVLLDFTMDSSDVGDFGVNTPTFFAIDYLTWGADVKAPPVNPGADVKVPEPSCLSLLVLGLGAAVFFQRRTKKFDRCYSDRREMN